MITTRKPRRLPRLDLSYLEPPDALAAAMDSFDNAAGVLLCARQAQQTTRFGAVVNRDDLPAYLRFAIAVEEAGHDTAGYLNVLLSGGVEDHDVNLVTGLMAAVAQQAWRARNLTAEQIRCASIVTSGAPPRVDLLLWPRN